MVTSSPEEGGPFAWFRSKAFDAAFAVWTGLFGVAIPVLWLCGPPRPVVRALTRLWVRGTLLALKGIVGLDHRQRGRERVPREPCLIVANHQSTWETLAFLVLFPDVAIVAKQELLAIPVFGWYLRHSPMIIIDRETGSRALREMVDHSRAALAQGRSVLVFPEGTRKPVTDRVAFKRGVELLYARLGVPVLAVAVDSGRFWPPGRGMCKNGGSITVSHLGPIQPGLPGMEFTRLAETLLESGKHAPSGPGPRRRATRAIGASALFPDRKA